MTDYHVHLSSIIQQLHDLAAYFNDPRVVIAAVVLYLLGSLIYVVISCRREENRTSFSGKIISKSRNKHVPTDEHS